MGDDLPKDRSSLSELTTAPVDSHRNPIVNSVPEQSLWTVKHTFTWRQVEIAARYAHDEPYSKINKDLDVNKDPRVARTQISNSLSDFYSTAKLMRLAVQKLSREGYYLKQDKPRRRDLAKKSKLARLQMKREGRCPDRNVPYGYTLDENKYYRKDLERNEVSSFIEACSQGAVPETAAKQFHIPHTRALTILTNPIYKGAIRSGGEIVRVDSNLAWSPPKVWDKAHKLWATRKKGRHRAPWCTQWLGPKLVLNDPENKISKMCQLRLDRRSYKSIAPELEVSWGTIRDALQRLDLYVQLGAISKTTLKKVKRMKISHFEAAHRKPTVGSKNREKILTTLDYGKRLRTCEIAQLVRLDHHTVYRHLHESKLVDREPGEFGRWFRKPPAEKTE